jgi:hypothetical protein
MALFTIGEDLALADGAPRSWCELYGVDEDGAVLVRPDGHVAWRARTSTPDAAGALRAACASAVGRAPVPRPVNRQA